MTRLAFLASLSLISFPSAVARSAQGTKPLNLSPEPPHWLSCRAGLDVSLSPSSSRFLVDSKLIGRMRRPQLNLNVDAVQAP